MRLAKTHFEIVKIEEQYQTNYYVRDLESHCGIYINDQKANDSNKWYRLENGDKLLFFLWHSTEEK